MSELLGLGLCLPSLRNLACWRSWTTGKEKAVAYWRAHSEEFDAILVEKDGTVSVTENIADQFTPDDAVKKTEIITKQ